MQRWKPLLKPGVDLKSLPLQPEEGFLASRIDGATDLHQLELLTGLPPERLRAALKRLVELGAVAAEGCGAEGAPESPGMPEVRADGLEAPGAADGAGEEPEPDAVPAEDPEGPDEGKEWAGTHRRLYELELHPLALEERIQRARTAGEPELSAFCFDPVPRVIQAVLGNVSVGLVHARLIAAHHANAEGLEQLISRPAFALDAGVRRALVRNSQLQAGMVRRLFGGLKLLEQFKLFTSREATERTRSTARELLRSRFATASADERVELIVKTEGRCLASLSGLGFDGRTTALLCGRTYGSTLFIQSFARFGATPPTLITHLLRQELVKRSPTLRAMLERHPNCPKEAKG